MNKTSIAWTTFSSNPLKYRRKSDGKTVWACVKTSPGCAHCYSEQIAMRYERGKLFSAKNMEELEPFLDEAELRQLLTRKTCDGVAVYGSRIFVGDMTDLFGPWVPDEFLDRLFATFALRPDATFQVLTKRAERMQAYCSQLYQPGRICDAAIGMGRALHTVEYKEHGAGTYTKMTGPDWPLSNVHLGVSVENQEMADARIPILLKTPTAVRFLSVEPMLEDISLSWPIGTHAHLPGNLLDGIDWVIVGGESGPHARPFHVEWARSIRYQCRAAGVACFVKQLGAKVVIRNDSFSEWPNGGDDLTVVDHGPAIQGEDATVRLKDRAGADPSEWPDYLRIQEFPKAVMSTGE